MPLEPVTNGWWCINEKCPLNRQIQVAVQGLPDNVPFTVKAFVKFEVWFLRKAFHWNDGKIKQFLVNHANHHEMVMYAQRLFPNATAICPLCDRPL